MNSGAQLKWLSSKLISGAHTSPDSCRSFLLCSSPMLWPLPLLWAPCLTAPCSYLCAASPFQQLSQAYPVQAALIPVRKNRSVTKVSSLQSPSRGQTSSGTLNCCCWWGQGPPCKPLPVSMCSVLAKERRFGCKTLYATSFPA